MNQQHVTANSGAKKAQAKPQAFFQPKLTVNEPGDVYEQEADAMADRVMRMTGANAGGDAFFKPSYVIQRKCQACEEEEQQVQRKESGAGETQAAPDIDSYVSSLGSSGQPIPETSRHFFESRFGQDFSGVRLHTDAVAAKSAQSINALAYTTGNNIVFNSGQYSPGSPEGQRLMAHELTHVVQQTGTVQRKHLSFEMEDIALTGATAEEKVKNWMKDNIALIDAAESKWSIDRRAIAGAIAWEALENPLNISLRAVGLGKVHVKENRFSEGNPVSKQVEDRGYLPKQSLDDRRDLLRTPAGAIDYIGAIMKAFADTAATAGYNVKCQPAILCTFYNGFDLPKAEALFKTKKYPTPLSPSPDMMGHWVDTNIPYLEDCVGKTGLCYPGDFPTPAPGNNKNVAAKLAGAPNVAAFTSAGGNTLMTKAGKLPALSRAPVGLISRDDAADPWDDIAKDVFGKADYAAYKADISKNSGSFFGMPLSNCHQKMIDKFAVVEADLKKSQPAGYKPPKISDIFRNHKSMHGWGMAVDFDVLKNPYVLNEGSDVKLNKQLPEVYDRIADFMLGKEKSAVNQIKKGRGAFGGKVDNVYDQLQQESDAMKQYFGFLDKGDDELDKFITDTWVPNHAGPPQAAADVRKIIISDYKQLGGQYGTDPKLAAPPGEDRPFAPISGGGAGDPKTGFLNLDKAFVMAMTNAGFAWGAIDIPGQSGDIQHFDMRIDGDVGQKVMNKLYAIKKK